MQNELKTWYELVWFEKNECKPDGADAYVMENPLNTNSKWEEVGKDSISMVVQKIFEKPLEYFNDKEKFESDGLIMTCHDEGDIAGDMAVHCDDNGYYLIGKYFDYDKKWDEEDNFIGWTVDYYLVMVVRKDVFEELFWKE